jgi:hypothetical protein
MRTPSPIVYSFFLDISKRINLAITTVIVIMALASTAVGERVTITTTNLPNAVVDTFYAAVVTATHGCTPYKCGDSEWNAAARAERTSFSVHHVLQDFGNSNRNWERFLYRPSDRMRWTHFGEYLHGPDPAACPYSRAEMGCFNFSQHNGL